MNHKKILLEICIASVDDALTAAPHAERLELNAAMSLGGLTPSLGTLLEVKAATTLPVMVMVRPRPGGFCYSAADFKVMQRDIDLCLTHGADGIVFGVLHEDGTIDLERCRTLVEQIGSRPAVFHRAFDVTPDPLVALEQLVDLGLRRLMSSGQQENAYYGAELLATLIEKAQGRIEILPAGGINRFTITDVLKRTGCDQVHASLRGRSRDASTQARPQINFGSAVKLPEDAYDNTSAAAVAELAGLLRPGRPA